MGMSKPLLLLMLQQSTSWSCLKSPVIYRGFIHLRWWFSSRMQLNHPINSVTLQNSPKKSVHLQEFPTGPLPSAPGSRDVVRWPRRPELRGPRVFHRASPPQSHRGRPAGEAGGLVPDWRDSHGIGPVYCTYMNGCWLLWKWMLMGNVGKYIPSSHGNP